MNLEGHLAKIFDQHFWPCFSDLRVFSELFNFDSQALCNICAQFNYSQLIPICVFANTDVYL